MDYDALRLFVSLSRTLHFARTSRECHISPSALTRAVQRLEQELGCALLERDHRTVKLTPEGESLRAHAADTLERWQDLNQKLQGAALHPTGVISLFASVTACQSFLPRVLSAFRQRYPDIHIKLETGYAADAFGMLAREAVDVAIAALPDRVPAGLVSRVLLHTSLVFVAPASDCEPSRMVARRPVPWGQVPIVLPASGLARDAADRWFRRRRLRPSIYSEVPGSEAILSLVALGCGIGIVPELVAARSPLSAEVRVLPATPPLGGFRVGVCTPARKLKSPLVKAFWDSLEPEGDPAAGPGRASLAS